MAKKLFKQQHVLTFFADAYKFIDKHGFTSDLLATKDVEISDVDELWDDLCNSPAGMIAEIQNICGEYTERLRKYYEENGNKKELNRLNKLIVKYSK